MARFVLVPDFFEFVRLVVGSRDEQAGAASTKEEARTLQPIVK